MAYIIHPQDSLLESVVQRIRRTTMNDWVKLGLALAGYAILTWSLVQQHEYRLDKIEDGMEQHLQKHEEQNQKIQSTLTQIQIEISKLTK